MELATRDLHSVTNRVNRRLRESGLALGDVIALDAVVAPALRALSDAGALSIRTHALALRAADAAAIFVAEFEAAVRATAGTAFDDELERIGFKGTVPMGGRAVHAFFELHI